jgi:hypothetical protein
MTTPTTAEQVLIYTRPHKTRLYLSIYEPPTALAAQVNWTGSMDGLREVPFDSVTEGEVQAVESGMTLLVGTTPGGDDRGKVRVRSGNTGSTLTLAENNDIQWADDLYLTVLRYWEVWPVYPRYVQNGLDITFYKDYDIPYTDQNEVYGTFINMGPHHAAFLEDNSACVYYSASGTTDLFGRGLEYDWAFEGGADTTGSTEQTPGWVCYDSPGHFTTRLIVTVTGTSIRETSYRHVSIYNRPEVGVGTPLEHWGFSSDLSGDRASGGWDGRIWVHNPVNRSKIRDGALAVVWSEDWYGNTKQSIGGNASNRSSIFFVGYIKAGTISWNAITSAMEFDVVSISDMMKQREAFSVSVESKAAPAAWDEVLDMDVRRALYHYYKWHSTLFFTCDFEFRGTDYPVQYFDADRQSLYDGGNTLMDSGLLGALVCDRQGKVWAEVDVSAMHNATGTMPVASDIFKGDWVGTPEVQERQLNETSMLELGGVAYSGPTTGTSTELLSQAPGNAPAYSGRLERLSGLILLDQGQLNSLSGDVFAYRNSRYPELEMEFAGNYRYIDIAPQEALLLTVGVGDTDREVSWTRKPFTIRSQSWLYNPEWEVVTTRGTLAEVTAGTSGSTLGIPEEPPDDQYELPDLHIPPLPRFLLPDVSPKVYGEVCVGCTLDDGPGVVIPSGEWTALIGAQNLRIRAYPNTWVLGGATFVPPLTGYYLANVENKQYVLPNGISFVLATIGTIFIPPGGSMVTEYWQQVTWMQFLNANAACCFWAYQTTGAPLTIWPYVRLCILQPYMGS